MENSLKKVDMYGVQFTFNTFGQSKFKTKLGGILTLFTISIVGLFTYIFGTDFWHKENPNVTPKDLVHMTTKKIKITNEKYSFMIGLQNSSSNLYNYEEVPIKVFGTYYHLKKNGLGIFEHMCNTFGQVILTKCSNTKATLNPDLNEEKLDKWLCWDMDKIKQICREQRGKKEPDYEPFIGGFQDEDEYSIMAAHFVNYVWDFQKNEYSFLAKQEEIDKHPGIAVNLRFPNISYDSNKEDNPIQTYYDTEFILIDTNTWRRDWRYTHLVTAIDDNGWIFSTKTENNSLIPDKVTSQYAPSNYYKGEVRFFFSAFNVGSKKEKVYKRSFMKLQTLVAVVGGMLKSVTNVLLFVVVIRAIKERDDLLVNEFYKVKLSNNSEHSHIQLNSREAKVDTVVGQKENTEASSCSFWKYLFAFCRKNAEQVKQVKVTEQMKTFMYQKLDIAYLFKLFEEFSCLKQIVLTEEQKELLEKNKIEVEVDG